MLELGALAQMVSVISACWAIVAGIGAWKREFIGKRKIELAEQVLACFYEVRDAIGNARSPLSYSSEGSSRQKGEYETESETRILNQAYVVIERLKAKQDALNQFQLLRYRFMASFGAETEPIFVGIIRTVNTISITANMLATHYWSEAARDVAVTSPDLRERYYKEKERHERIFWDHGGEDDQIRKELREINDHLERVVRPCFEEPSSLYVTLTTPLKAWAKKQVRSGT